jgi:hypothetical protein
MTFDEWWEINGKGCPNAERLFVDRIFAETVWDAAQEAVLMPPLGARDEQQADNVDTN